MALNFNKDPFLVLWHMMGCGSGRRKCGKKPQEKSNSDKKMDLTEFILNFPSISTIKIAEIFEICNISNFCK